MTQQCGRKMDRAPLTGFTTAPQMLILILLTAFARHVFVAVIMMARG